jgi:hypothetical protein
VTGRYCGGGGTNTGGRGMTGSLTPTALSCASRPSSWCSRWISSAISWWCRCMSCPDAGAVPLSAQPVRRSGSGRSQTITRIDAMSTPDGGETSVLARQTQGYCPPQPKWSWSALAAHAGAPEELPRPTPGLDTIESDAVHALDDRVATIPVRFQHYARRGPVVSHAAGARITRATARPFSMTYTTGRRSSPIRAPTPSASASPRPRATGPPFPRATPCRARGSLRSRRSPAPSPPAPARRGSTVSPRSGAD